MIELRQNLPLVAETPDNIVRVQPAPNDLDRNLFAIFVVGSRGQVDGAQPAPADFANELIRAELPANERLLHVFRKQIAGDGEGWLLDEAVGLFVRFEKGFYFAAESFIAATFLIEESRALVRIEVDSGLE